MTVERCGRKAQAVQAMPLLRHMADRVGHSAMICGGIDGAK
jgi:hypothetical protein